MASTQETLLRVLRRHGEEYVSGERLGEELQISRASVWKAMRRLEADGCRIEAVTNRGYRLIGESDRLTSYGIASFLPEESGISVEAFDEIDSTNLYGRRRLAGEGGAAPERMLIAADRQTGGRGRRGKSFFSPAGCGLYLTLVLRRRQEAVRALPVTMAAAVAVCRTIREFSDTDPKIKWVNDIWIGEKKVCGILTEAVSDLESGVIEAVIVGIGVNVHTPEGGFPEELAQIAGSVGSLKIPRSRLAAEIGSRLFAMMEDPASDRIFEAYREDSLVIGREIVWTGDEGSRTGRVRDLNRQGNLIVDTEDGEVILAAGEISVRPLCREGDGQA